MAKTSYIELPTGETLPILYEDRAALAIDKPAGWMLIPFSWQQTSRNLQAAITSSIAARAFWARSRNLRFLRYVHRLDTETSGILLFGKSPGAVRALSERFESRRMEKVYLAVVASAPASAEWTCRLQIAPDPRRHGRMKTTQREGKPAETRFRVLQTTPRAVLIEALPMTGRTHQIRVHLAAAGHPIVGDELYGRPGAKPAALGLRAVKLAYEDPFTRRHVEISAPVADFLSEFGFAAPGAEVS